MSITTAINMTPEVFGRRFARGVLMAFGQMFLLGFATLFAAALIAHAFGYPTRDSTDGPYGRSGMRPLTDHLTGCQYLQSSEGALTPRLTATGQPMCGKGGF